MEPDLQISLSGTPSVGPGGFLVYSLEVENTGGDTPAGTNVVVENTLPSDFVVSSIISGGSFISNLDSGNNIVTFTASSLGSGDSARFTIIGTVAQGTTVDSLESTAAVDPPIASGGNIDEGVNEDNNTAAFTTAIDTALGPDLSVTKSAGPNPVAPGGILVYTLTVANEGQASASNIEVVDDLPDNFTVSSVISGGNFISNFDPNNPPASPPNEISFTGGTLAAGAEATFTIIGTTDPNSPDDITNVVSVDPNNQITESGDDANNTFTITTDVDVTLGPNLTINKLAGPDPVAPGGVLVYTLEVTNNGSATATGIEVLDDLPDLFTPTNVISGGNFTSDFDPNNPPGSPPNEIRFTGGTLAAGASATFTIIGNAPEAASAELVNVVQVDPGNGILEGNESDADNIETITTTVDAAQGPNLTISKLAGPDPVAPGGVLVYTLEVTNNGLATATGIEVLDDLPDDFTPTNVISGGNFTSDFDPNNPPASDPNEIRFTGGTLAAGASATFTIIGTAPQIASGQLVNVAVVDPGNAIIEGNEEPEDNIETITTSVNTSAGPDLAVSKLAGPNPVAPGGVLVYTLEVTNNGSATATNVVVRDDLPDEFTATSVISGGNFTSDTSMPGEVTFSGGTLAVGDSATFTIIGTVSDNPTSNQLINTVVADPAVVGENLLDNTATTSTTISLPDLTIDKAVSASSVVAGDIVVYTLTVNNEGPVPANDILVEDALPGNFLVDNILPGGDFTSSAVPVAPNRVQPGVVSFSGGSLPAGGSATFTIIGRFTSSGEIVNTVVVDPNSDIAEDNNTNNAENNNTATVSVSVAAPSLVFVDDDWANLNIGDDVDPDGAAGTEFAMGDGVFGINAFSNIQGGEQTVASGGTVRVFAGTYGEIVGIGKPVSLIGPQAGVAGDDASRDPEVINNSANEAIITGDSAGISFLSGATAGQVIVDGFRLEGLGTAPGAGAAIDITNGGDNTIIRNNVIVDFDNDAIRNFPTSIPDPNLISPTSNLVIEDNLIDGMESMNISGFQRGMFLQDVENLTVTGNVVRDLIGGDKPGILLDTVTGTVVVSENRVENIASQGIQVAGIGSIANNGMGTGTVTITGNDLRNVNEGPDGNPTTGDVEAPTNGGIRLRNAIPNGQPFGTGAVLSNGTVVIENNTIRDTYNGIYVRDNTVNVGSVTATNNRFFNISPANGIIVNNGLGQFNAVGNFEDLAGTDPLDAADVSGSVLI